MGQKKIRKTKTEVAEHKAKMIDKFDNFLEQLISHEDSSKYLKADKISYWMEDWMKYQRIEDYFKCHKMPKFKRGSIVKVQLGFNVGNEEGGLHYAIVLDNSNSLYNSLVTVVPLTSVKPTTNVSKLHKSQLFIGDELYGPLFAKANNIIDALEKVNFASLNEVEQKKYGLELNQAKRVLAEITKMKNGSIVLIGQITTVSKIRIYDPKERYDVLHNIKVSNDVLDKIDDKLKEFYLKTENN